eukprot:jgi/Psemu1/316324/fgenesh1_kg.3162_\
MVNLLRVLLTSLACDTGETRKPRKAFDHLPHNWHRKFIISEDTFLQNGNSDEKVSYLIFRKAHLLLYKEQQQ